MYRVCAHSGMLGVLRGPGVDWHALQYCIIEDGCCGRDLEAGRLWLLITTCGTDLALKGSGNSAEGMGLQLSGVQGMNATRMPTLNPPQLYECGV